MPDMHLIASHFFTQIGFEAAEHQLMLDAVDYYLNRTIIAVDNFSNYYSNNTVIMAFSFGADSATNQGLAAATKAILAKRRFPIFAQWEVANTMRELGLHEAFKSLEKSVYSTTEVVIMQFIEEFKRQNLKIDTAIVVAHPDHFFRCKRLVEKHGIYAVLPSQILNPPDGWRSYGCDEWGYDPHASQEWAASRPRFILMELLTLLNQ